MRTLRLTLVASLAALAVFVPAALAQPLGPNIVVNGDFEAPVVCPAQFATLPPAGWTLEQGTVDLVCFTFWMPASGLQSVDLTGTPGQGTISQNLTTVPGERYRLRFAMAGNPDPACQVIGEGTTRTMEVSWGGSVVATLSVDVSGRSFADMGWTYHDFTLVAPGTPTELQFRSLTGTFCGPALDDVSVQQILDDDDDDGDDDDDDDDDGDDDDDDDDGDDDDDDDD
jgi:choice-of-anchor C domain-containing protein